MEVCYPRLWTQYLYGWSSYVSGQWFEERNFKPDMMLIGVLLLAALFSSDVAAELLPKSAMDNKSFDLNDGQCGQSDKQLCPDGVVYFGRCFTLVSEKKNWLDAEAHCQKLAPGGHLASIHCEKQFDFIISTIPKVSNKHLIVWIGLNDIKAEGNHIWIDGTPTDFTKWHKDEPNNMGNEDCVQIEERTISSWNDMHCGHLYSSICSYKLPCE
ncbi:lectin-like [Scyliorhinus torazame]|uniref:lectin-like n=1 Tax=Scyliorhinus torazame TaxID=75743 RepID=UPI003B59CA60